MNCPACHEVNPEGRTHCHACGQPLVTLGTGAVVGERYEVLGALGRGGMGAVYKVRDRELDETVALKVLSADAAGTPMAEQRLRSEIKLARKVSHPNVCRIFEFGRDGASSFIVMEYIEGKDLKRLLRAHGPLPEAQAFEVSIAVASALQAVHDAGVIHRDLKTPNIMLGDDGSVKLMDFGIAKNADAGVAGLTSVGQVIGTPEYMSPEQARALPADARSDIYALGIVVFEVFAGTTPIRGETPLDTLLKQVNEPPPLDGPLALGLPKPLLPVLDRALAKDPAARYASAREMGEALAGARAAAEAAAASSAGPTPPAAGERSAPASAGPTAQMDLPTQVRPQLEPPPPVGSEAPTVQRAQPIREQRPPRDASPRPPAPPSREPDRPGAGLRPVVWGLVLVALLAASALTALLVWRSRAPASEQQPMAQTTPQTVPEPRSPPDRGAWGRLDALASSGQFSVNVEAGHAEYREGELLTLDVTSPEDGYLNVLNVGEGETEAVVLFPNGVDRDNAVRAGQRISIPGAGAPFALPAQLPEGRERQEILIVVLHTRTRLDAYAAGEGAGPLRTLSSEAARGLGEDAAESGRFGAGRVLVTITR